MNSKTRLIDMMVDVCHRLYENGFVTATDGNISVRCTDGNILTTCTSINKGSVFAEHIIEVDDRGRVMNGKYLPSTELKMHLFIYQQRKDVGAVVHAHPIYATGFATARKPFPQNYFPEVIINIGRIPLAKYGTPGTEEMANSLASHIHTCDAMLLMNHGVVTCGKDIWDAYYKMEKVEHAANISFVATMIGGGKPLSRSQVKKLLEMRKRIMKSRE